jgi:16S rRNA (adenine1518-N6/adenine1519-N6)-dimethyltransferase
MTESGKSRGHTLGYLRQLFSERSIRPRGSLGQCFLVDLNILDVLLNHAELDSSDFVLEVGAGTGSLTERLAARAASVVSVEVDPRMHALAADVVRSCPNVTLIQADVLRGKNSLNPQVADAIAAVAGPGSSMRRKLVANLPYCVATPVISLLLLSEFDWERFVVTIQKEVADRLVAGPGGKDYGGLSVLAQALADVEMLRELPPSVFWPRPSVSSAIVMVRPSAAKRAAIADLARFAAVVRGVMLYRRKNLRGALGSWLADVSKPEIDGFLAQHGFDGQRRAESFTVAEFIALAEKFPWPARGPGVRMAKMPAFTNKETR